MELFPIEIVAHILSYDKRFKMRKGKLVDIIPYDDPRRSVLTTLPRVNFFGHVLLAETDTYEFHIRVNTSKTHVRWTFYKYFKNENEEEADVLMDGVVFSMERAPRAPLEAP